MANLREYLNAKIKSKGSSLSAEKAKGKKYKSIAAAKKAGALYYTNKSGKLMAAVYAEDLKKPISKLAPKKSARPKARPKPVSEAVFVERANKKLRALDKALSQKKSDFTDFSREKKRAKLEEAMDALGITVKTRRARGFDPMNLVGPKKKKPAKKKSNIK